MVYLIEKLPIPVLLLGEGPHWDCETGTLKLVDIDSAKVYSYNPSTQKYAELALGKVL
jgi:sugar lactone lactonase YvrE